MDTRTLWIVVAVISLSVNLILLMLFWTRQTYKGFGLWTLATTLRSVAMLLYIPRESSWPGVNLLVANALLCVSFVLDKRGLLDFRERPQHNTWDLALLGVVLGLFVQFIFITPDFPVRVLLHSGCAMLFQLWMVQITLTQRPAYFGSADRLLTGTLGMLTLLNLLRAAQVSVAPTAETGILSYAGVWNAVLLVNLVAWTLVLLAQIVMNAQRIEHDLRQAHDQLARDMTQLQLTKASLAQSETKYRMLTESMKDNVWVLDTHERRFTYVSPSIQALRGFSAEEIMQAPVDAGLVAGSREAVTGQLRRRREAFEAAAPGSDGFYTDEVELNCKDGSTVWTEIITRFVRNTTTGHVDIQGVTRDISQRKALQEQLRTQAITDELTGLPNRRWLLELTQSEIRRARRLRHPLSLAVIDLDHFKQINDLHGHAAGDQALVAFTDTCRKIVREIDVLARFGGDEFVLLLPATAPEQAMEILQRLRLTLASQVFEVAGTRLLLTVSAGVSHLSDPHDSVDTLLERADQALYQAKAAGRNSVVRYSDTLALRPPRA